MCKKLMKAEWCQKHKNDEGSKPAGAKSDSVLGNQPTKLQESQDGDKPAHVPGCQPTICRSTSLATPTQRLMAQARHQYANKPQQVKPKWQSLEEARKDRRFERMPPYRNLEIRRMGDTRPRPHPGAKSKLNKPISRFETSPSPRKMPRPPPPPPPPPPPLSTTSACGTRPQTSISHTSLHAKEKAKPQTDHSQPGAAEDRKSADEEPKQMEETLS